MMSISALRIEWTKAGQGLAKSPAGFSLHISREDAEANLSALYNGMQIAVPNDYCYPDQGWADAIRAQPVVITDRNDVFCELRARRSMRVFFDQFGMNAQRYKTTRDLPAAVEAIVVAVKGQVMKPAHEHNAPLHFWRLAA
jgi:hypothetical protein